MIEAVRKGCFAILSHSASVEECDDKLKVFYSNGREEEDIEITTSNMDAFIMLPEEGSYIKIEATTRLYTLLEIGLEPDSLFDKDFGGCWYADLQCDWDDHLVELRSVAKHAFADYILKIDPKEDCNLIGA